MRIDTKLLTPAELLLWNYGVTEPAHIDLEAIAADNGADVVYRPLGGCEARLVVKDNNAIISISSDSINGRQRFSLAHELAHWLCDRSSGLFLCAKEDIGPISNEAKQVEANANGYASQLILPSYLVLPFIDNKEITLDLASLISKDYNSSLTAAAIKIIKATHKPACLVCHGQEKLNWFQKSASFPRELYANQTIHHDTEAMTMVFGGSPQKTRPKREPANRWVSGRDVYKMDVLTQSVKLPDGTVLTTILTQ